MDALEIHFGTDTTWEIAGGDRIASFNGATDSPHGSSAIPASALAAAIADALANPLGFPALDHAVVAGDRLVLAVDTTLPALPEVTAGIANWFSERGSDPANIRVVLAGDTRQVPASLLQRLRETLPGDIKIEVHDPDDPEKLAYVAANDASDPIYLNRSMVDADVVLPVSCARPLSGLDYFGAFSLFPLLSDRATRRHFYSLPKLEDAAERDKLQAWANQAAWWLGVVAGVEAVPASGNGVASLWAGSLDQLEQECQRAMSAVWKTPTDQSDMIVALVDGPASQQTWLGVARAVYTATKCVNHRGTIVVCTQLEESIGRGLNRLREPHQTPEAISKKLAKDASDDAIAAAVVLEATTNHHVYLVSNLRPQTVESLGLGVISEAAQLQRLLQQHNTCTILGSTQHRPSHQNTK